MDLPIPKTLRGWIASISVLIITFVLYYIFLFPYLERFYRGFLYTEKPKGVIPGLTMRLDGPDYLAPYGQRWLYFTIRNDTNRPISDLWIGLEVQKDGQDVEGWIFPFLYRSSMSAERSVHIEQLQPGLSFSGRLPFYGSAFGSASPVLTATVIIASPEITAASGLTTTFPSFQVRANSLRYLAHSFIEQILLPPWSNGVIVIAVFIVCTQLERRFNLEEKWYRWLWEAIRSSVVLLLAVGGIALALPAIPWWQQDVNGFLITLLFSIFMLYGLKWAMGVDFPLPFLLFLKNKWAMSKTINKVKNAVAPLFRPLLRLIQQIKVRIPQQVATAMSDGYILVFLFTTIWILGQWLCKPILPLLQPLPWMALAVAVLRVMDILIHLAYSEGKDEPKRSES